MDRTIQKRDALPAPSVTRTTYNSLADAFDRFNRDLFGGELTQCLITFQRHRRARGYFWHEAVARRKGARRIDEIALNPNTFPDRSDREVLSTLVHEMVHLWQAHYGKPGRRGYHNRQWAAKMDEVGLCPSNTGRRGGHRTGERMTHYIKRGGRFETVWKRLEKEGFRLNWQTHRRPPTDRAKVKYTCPECGLNVWAKPGLDGALGCLDCRLVLREHQ